MRKSARPNERQTGTTGRWNFAPLLALLTGLLIAPPARADWLPVGRIETESIQSLTYGLSAFCRCAGIPYNLMDLNQLIAQRLAIPNLAGIDLRERVVLHLLVDGDAPRASARVATLAVVALADNGATLLANLNAVHARREEQVWGVIFTAPREGFSGHDRLAVSLRGGKAYLADTPDVIAWAMKPGRTVLTSPAGSGQLLVTANPSELGACLSATNAMLAAVKLPTFSLLPTGLVERAFVRLPDLIEQTEALSLSLNANGHALSATLNLAFKPASPRQAWLTRSRPHERWYGALAPNAATLATVASQSGRGGWRELLGWTPAPHLPTLDELVGDRLTGDSLVYIDQTRTGDGIALVAVAKVIDPGEVRRRLAKNLDGRVLPSGLSIVRTADRRHNTSDIQCFSLTNSAAAKNPTLIPIEPSTLNALAGLLAKITVIETTVVGQDMALVAGPSGSIEAVIDDLHSGRPPYAMLPERSRLLAQDVPVDASSVALLKPVAMLRQIIATLPGYKTEQMAAFALPGDGLFAWSRVKDGHYTGTLRIAANEVDALQNVLTRGRPIIQELLLQMVMQQILGQPESVRR